MSGVVQVIITSEDVAEIGRDFAELVNSTDKPLLMAFYSIAGTMLAAREMLDRMADEARAHFIDTMMRDAVRTFGPAQCAFAVGMLVRLSSELDAVAYNLAQALDSSLVGEPGMSMYNKAKEASQQIALEVPRDDHP